VTARLVVLDASAVLAFVLDEHAGDTVRKLLPVGIIPAPNLTEVLYRAQERGYRNTPQALYTLLLETGLAVEPLTEDDAVRAAELIAASRATRNNRDDPSLSLGDGLCCAVAERLNLALTGGDAHWSTLDLKVDYFPIR